MEMESEEKFVPLQAMVYYAFGIMSFPIVDLHVCLQFRSTPVEYPG
jgi:hypothetical protein